MQPGHVYSTLLSKKGYLHYQNFLFLKMFLLFYSLHAEQIFGSSYVWVSVYLEYKVHFNFDSNLVLTKLSEEPWTIILKTPLILSRSP